MCDHFFLLVIHCRLNYIDEAFSQAEAKKMPLKRKAAVACDLTAEEPTPSSREPAAPSSSSRPLDDDGNADTFRQDLLIEAVPAT